MGKLFLIFWFISSLFGISIIKKRGFDYNLILAFFSAALGTIMTMFLFAVPVGIIYGLICVFTTVSFSFAALFLVSMGIVGILSVKRFLGDLVSDL